MTSEHMTDTRAQRTAFLFPELVCAACGDPRSDHVLVSQGWNLSPDMKRRTVIYRNTSDKTHCRFRVAELVDGTWYLVKAPYRTPWIQSEEDWS